MNELTSARRWWTVPDIVDALGVSLPTVRGWLDEGDIVGVRRGERSVLSVPADFFDDAGPLPALKGTLTVLRDGGMDEAEAVGWLLAQDPSLPTPGAPVDALRAGFVTEVRRRAMESAW